MNKMLILSLTDKFKLHSGITQRYLELLNETDLDWKPVDNVRTVRELIVHMYSQIVTELDAIQKGSLTKEEDELEEKKALSLPLKELLDYCKQARNDYLEFVGRVTETELEKVVHIFYGDFPVGMMLGFVYDEHLHHRGQLSFYLRVRGYALPFAYDFENNTI